MPERIQLRRTKGWRLPAGARSVARPTKYGNPYRVGTRHAMPTGEEGGPATAEDCVEWHRNIVWREDDSPRFGVPTLAEIKAELAGHDLACWCRLGAPCHADTLLAAANSATCSRCGDCCDPVILGTATYQALFDPEPVYASTPKTDANRAFVQAHWTPVSRSDDQIALRCDAFDPVARLCAAYEGRPPICADFPYYGASPEAWGRGRLPERCSFRADVGDPVALVRKPRL